MDKSVDQETQTPSEVLNIERIMELIPHRQPFLLIDKVKDIVPGESACGIKNVTINEPFFAGHFPAKPIMPGVLIVEAMAQTAAVMVMYTLNATQDGTLVYFMSIDEAKFRKPVVPGDTVEIRVAKQRSRGNVWRFKGEAWVGDALMAQAVYSAMIVEQG